MKNKNIVNAIALIAVGLLLMILGNDIIGIAFTIIGAMVIIQGIVDCINHQTKSGVIKIIVGVALIALGWILISIILIIVSILFLASGIFELVLVIRSKLGKEAYIKPILSIVVATLLLFNQKGTIDWIFIVAGLCLVIEGLLVLFSKKNKKIEYYTIE